MQQMDHKGEKSGPDQSPGTNRDTPPADTAAPVRSESLLPVEDDDRDDGRYAVAEEVSLDQQSDRARKVGQPPDPTPARAGAPPAASGTLSDALDSEQKPQAEDAGAAKAKPLGKEELRLMADTMPGDGPGD